MKRRALLSAALLLAGCAVGPDYKRPELQVPPEFRGHPADVPVSEKSIADLAWWEVFQDPVLQELLRTALGVFLIPGNFVFVEGLGRKGAPAKKPAAPPQAPAHAPGRQHA